MWKFSLICTVCISCILIATSSTSSDLEISKKGCNATSSIVHGSFHLNVFNETVCYWSIGTDPKTNVTDPISLYFMYLFMHPDDKIDIYETYDDAVSNTNNLTDTIRTQDGSVTVITEKKNITVKYQGGSAPFIRNLEFLFDHGCQFAVPLDVEIINSPIYATNITKTNECIYMFNKDHHKRVTQVLSFESYNLKDSSVTFEGSSADGEYNNENPQDIFLDLNKEPMKLTAKMHFNSSDSFKLRMSLVDSKCSGVIEADSDFPSVLKSPPDELNNGTIIPECRKLIKHKESSRLLGFNLGIINFISVFDIIAVNDGLSLFSPPLLQVTTSNQNTLRNQIIRSSKNYLWVSFKPVSYASNFTANVTVHGQGGHFKNSGIFSMKPTTGDDTVFQLEVEKGKNVMLNFLSSSFSFPATLSVYNSFDTSDLLTSLHGEIKYPVISKGSKMMIIASKFSGSNSFSANFSGIDPGCSFMSSPSAESYSLNQKCGSTCQWIILPQDIPNSILLLALEYVSLKEGDEITVHRLDSQMTQLGSVTANNSHVPHLTIAPNIGALVKVHQAPCEKSEEKVVLMGHLSYMPACNYTIKPKASEQFQITSPLYPDTYPLYSYCYWNISVSENQLLHMAFHDLKLAKNHCVRIIQHSSKTNITYDKETLPDDIFLFGSVNIEFDSSNCQKKEVTQMMKNDVGFALNITVPDCGKVFETASGQFNTSLAKGQKNCVWKIVVPPTVKDDVNIITYTVTKNDQLQNYDLHIYDGASVRENEIFNNSGSEIWSRTNSLIILYSRINASQPSSVFTFKYNTFSCNKTMQCENKICMHPDWRCNGQNDCGDFSDERSCESVPVTPKVLNNGYSGLILGISIVLALGTGIFIGLVLPTCIRRYRETRYTRFHGVSGIDT